MTEKEMYDRIHKNRKLGYFEEIPDWDFIDDNGKTLEENNKDIQKSILQERMQSEGAGRVEIMKGCDKPTYTEIDEEVDLEKAKDQIKGGLADKLSIEQIAEKHGVSVKSIKKQIKLGKKVEMEHTDDPKKAKEIAHDHLVEIPDYYTRLAKMEDEAKKENKENGK